MAAALQVENIILQKGEEKRTELGKKVDQGSHTLYGRGDTRLGDSMFHVCFQYPSGAASHFVNSLMKLEGGEKNLGYELVSKISNRGRLTFSKSASDSSLTGSADEKARWVTLIRGMIKCLERISAEFFCPRDTASHLHLKVSLSSSNAISFRVSGDQHGTW
jgi:hypothetical protein